MKNLWIKKSAETFGSQCLIACIDYRLKDNQINFFFTWWFNSDKEIFKRVVKAFRKFKSWRSNVT